MRPKVIRITSEQVISGKDTGMPPAMLHWGQAVSYKLNKEAKKLFKFKAPKQDAITLMDDGCCMLKDVMVFRHPKKLKLKIKHQTGAWTAKATLFFSPRSNIQPADSGLDPEVTNLGGKP
jgi:hypothetical protein